MRKFLSILIGLFLTVSFSMAQSNDETAEPVAYVNYVEGKVLFEDFQEVELNMIIQEGDEINATNGRTEILLKGGGVIRLDYNTRVVFAVLNEGSITLNVWGENIYVEKGEIEIGVKSESRSLNLSSEEWYLTAEKSFKKWNNRRNEELSPRDNEYLPEELGRYGGTLNYYGCWQHISPYGYVWTPYERHLRPGWRPYLYGRWDWYRSRRMWISYDPFGWPVHHYGRWHWGSSIGWYWIPMRTWGPAWVLWSILNDCIGWSPMYYGGYNSYYYRHYYNDYYGRSYGRAWTFVPRNRLRSRNVVKYVVHKNELKRRSPGNISSSQIRTSLSAASTRSSSKSVSSKSSLRSTGQISSKNIMNRKQSLQSQNKQSQPRQVRSISSKITNTYPSRTASRSKSTENSVTRKVYSPSSKIHSSSRTAVKKVSSKNPRPSRISSSRSSSSRTKISSSSRTKISSSSRTKISSSRRISRSSSSRRASMSASKSSARRGSRSSVSRSSSSRGASRSRPSQSSRSAKRVRRK